jgi:hemerythrin-like domain-containing protein
MSAEIDLISFFKNEHAVLLSRFEKHFSLAKFSYDWGSLYSICKSQFEENHHAKEERFIFDAVKNNSKIKSGGPLCTYFFDFHMTNPSLRRALEATMELTDLNLEPEWSPQMKGIRDLNLPLVIPGEDHEAGRIILRGIENLISRESSAQIQTKIEKLFEIYIEIQKEHFDREENCFFKMCADLIPPEQWNQIYFNMRSDYIEIRDST